MSTLRQQMIQDLQLGGLSQRTQEAYVRAVRQLAGMARDLLPVRLGRALAKVCFHLLEAAEEVELCSKLQRVRPKQFDALVECVTHFREPFGDMLGSLGFRDLAVIATVPARNRGEDAQLFADATEDSLALAHRRLDFQNSRKVGFAITGNSRERVQGLAGSKRVPFTTG